MAPVGCPIVDIAPSRKLNAQVEAFIQAEMLSESPAYSKMQEQLLVDSGLMSETPATILELRILMQEYKQYQANRKKK